MEIMVGDSFQQKRTCQPINSKYLRDIIVTCLDYVEWASLKTRYDGNVEKTLHARFLGMSDVSSLVDAFSGFYKHIVTMYAAQINKIVSL